MFFKQVEGEAAIIVENGVYKQVDVYERTGRLFVKSGGGFIGLMSDGSTTKAKAKLDTISFENLGRNATGRLFRSDLNIEDIVPLEPKTEQVLLGKPA